MSVIFPNMETGQRLQVKVDLEEGKLIFRRRSTEEGIKKIAKAASVGFVVGAMIGLIWGGVVGFIGGAAFGSLVGIIRKIGVKEFLKPGSLAKFCFSEIVLHTKDLYKIINKSKVDPQKLSAFSRALIEALNTDASEDIYCPISGKVMMIPVKLGCDKEKNHVFEFSSIKRWIKEGRNTCPTCQATIQSKNVQYDQHLVQKVVSAVSPVMEQLIRLSKESSPQIADFYSFFGEVGAFPIVIDDHFFSNQQDTPQRLQAGTLNGLEIYVLKELFREVVSVFDMQVNQIYIRLTNELTEKFNAGDINAEEKIDKEQCVGNWYRRAKINKKTA